MALIQQNSKNGPSQVATINLTALNAGNQVLGNFACRIAGYIIGFFGDILFARFLGVDQYGTFTLGMTIVSTALMLVGLGLPRAMVREIGRHQHDTEAIQRSLSVGLFYGLGFGIVGGTFLLVTSQWLSTSIFHQPKLYQILPLLAAFVPLLAVIQILQGGFEGFQLSAYSLSIKEVFGRLAKILLFAGIGFTLGFNVLTIAWAFILGEVLVLILFFVFTRIRLLKGQPIQWRLPSWPYQKYILSYSIAVGGSVVVNMFWSSGAILLLGCFTTSQQVGLYNVANNLAGLVIFGLSTINVVIMPLASKALKDVNHTQLQFLYHVSSNLIAITTLPIFATFLFYRKAMLSLYGPMFMPAEPAFILLCISSLINAVSGSNYPFLIMSEHYRFEFLLNSGAAILSLLCSLLLIPRYSIVGAGLAILAGQLFMNFGRSMLLFKHYRITPFASTYWRYFLVVPFLLFSHWVLSLHPGVPPLVQVLLFASCTFLLSMGAYYYLVASVEERGFVHALIRQGLQKFGR